MILGKEPSLDRDGTCPKLVCTLLGARASRPHPFVPLQVNFAGLLSNEGRPPSRLICDSIDGMLKLPLNTWLLLD